MSPIIYPKVIIKINETFHISLRNHYTCEIGESFHLYYFQIVIIPLNQRLGKYDNLNKFVQKFHCRLPFLSHLLKCMQINDVHIKGIHYWKQQYPKFLTEDILHISSLAWPELGKLKIKFSFLLQSGNLT